MESTRVIAGTSTGDGMCSRSSEEKRPILFVSNGHGEDAIGVALMREIARDAPNTVEVAAWPMVGGGEAYRSLGVPIIGPQNTLPSEGFGTLSARAFLRDLRAGWLDVHWRQWRAAHALRGAYTFLIAIGDVVPLVVASESEAPFAFVGCAKSAYYGGTTGYTWLERRLLRRATAVYPRDERTSIALSNDGVPVRWMGNPMMDMVADPVASSSIEWERDEVAVACLPGSRSDREHNAATMLTLIAQEHHRYAASRLTHFVFALPSSFDIAALKSLPTFDSDEWTWSERGTRDSVSARRGQLRATFAFHSLADILAHASVAIGLAGTANEQAVGSGVPVVTFATDGVQGDSYLRMKMPFFGASAVRVARNGRALCDALLRITGEKSLRDEMIAAGRERMGAPGATAAIAADIVALIQRTIAHR